MNLDFTQKLSGIGGKPIMLDEKTQARLADIAIGALSTPETEHGRAVQLQPSEQVRRYSLCLKISDSTGPIDIKAEDVTLIKRLIPAAYPSPMIGGPAIMLLDSAEQNVGG